MLSNSLPLGCRCLASRSGTSTAAQASSAGSMAAGAHLIEPQEVRFYNF